MIFQRQDERGIRIEKMLGLRNMVHPAMQPLGAMSECVNFDQTDTGGIERRDGYSQAVPLLSATDMYSPVRAEGLYVVTANAIVSFQDGLAGFDLVKAVTDTTFSWAETDTRVFYAGAVDAGIIYDRTEWLPLRVPTPQSVTVTPVAGTLPAGRYTISVTYSHIATGISGGATNEFYTLAAPGGLEIAVPAQAGYLANFYVSEPNGEAAYWVDNSATTLEYSTPSYSGLALDTEQRDGVELPTDIVGLTFHEGRLYAATYDAATDMSVVFWSGVFYPHVFALHDEYFPVRGQVLALHGTDSGLLVGTTDRIFHYDGENLRMLAAFGVVPGRPFATGKDKRTAIWTTRGVCVYPEFKAAQMDKVAVPPGSTCTSAVVERRGRVQHLVTTDGAGEAWNSYQ